MPKGFSEKAVTSFLTFLEAIYEDVLEDIDNGMDPREAVESELREVRRFLAEGFPKRVAVRPRR